MKEGWDRVESAFIKYLPRDTCIIIILGEVLFEIKQVRMRTMPLSDVNVEDIT